MTPAWTQWRSRANLTQEALAEIVLVDRATLSHIENGRRRPSLELVQRLSRALNLSVEERLIATGLSDNAQAIAA